jgi:hypothetical protein
MWSKRYDEIYFGVRLFYLVCHLIYRIINFLRIVTYVLLIDIFKGNIETL